jgi:hypothetical protein
MPVDVKIIKDIISFDALDALHRLSRDGRQPSGVNFFSYGNENVVGVSNAIFQFVLDEDLRKKIAGELIAKGVWLHTPKKWVAYVNLFSRSSFIPWHDDGKYVHTVTIYLNKRWDYDWGGALLYSLEEPPFKNVSCMYPEHNKGIVYTPPLYHTTTLTAINAPMRESLQIFVQEF